MKNNIAKKFSILNAPLYLVIIPINKKEIVQIYELDLKE